MALNLSQLLDAQTVDQWRSTLLGSLQGLGIVVPSNPANAGSAPSGTGSISLSGVPSGSASLVVKITGSGEIGTGQVCYSFDGGTTYSAPVLIPSSGVYPIGASGVSINFAAGPAGSGTSFVSGDLYSATISVPNFPATSWAAGSVPRDLLETDAQAFANLDTLVAAIAAGGLLLEASGSWLDLDGANVYNLTRNPAVTLIGSVQLSDAQGAGPFTINAGQLWFSAGLGGLRYNNTTGGTLAKNGTLTLTVQAESPGSAYNVGIGAVNTMATALPGVTVTNPNLGSGVWWTTAGVDQESDAAFQTRCMGRWSTLGTGATAAAYDYWARTGAPAVTRTVVVVDANNPGQVDVYLAGPNGPATGSDVTAATAYILQRAPLCDNPVIAAAVNHPIVVTASVIYDPTKTTPAALQTNINTVYAAYAATIPLGKSPNGTIKVYNSKLAALVEDITGVLSVTLSAPPADTSLALGEVATISTNSFSGWSFAAGVGS